MIETFNPAIDACPFYNRMEAYADGSPELGNDPHSSVGTEALVEE